MKTFFASLIAFCGVACVANATHGQDSLSEKREIDAVVVEDQTSPKVVEIFDTVNHYIKKTSNGIVRFPIKLQTLSPGDSVAGRMEIINSTTQPLELKQVRTSCGCLKVDARLAKLAVDERTVIKFSFVVPKGLASFSQSAIVDCNGEIDQIEITYEASIHDGVGFREDINQFQIDHQFKTVEVNVPCFYSNNLSEQDFEVSATGDLSQCKWRFELTENYTLRTEVPTDEIPPDGIDETLTIKLKRTGYSASTRIRVYLPDAIRVSPDTITFYKVGNDRSFIAHVLVSFSSEPPNKDIAISATLNDGQKCKVTQIRMGSRVVRVTLSSDESSEKLVGSELFANLEIGGESFKIPVEYQ
jgi:hypothetical protein